ncbi:hypothetical protein OU995_16920 [Roseateles sp. SL47]|uniref:hypothetical protein n=1 Tax=Roseateles sp. SL47 TaxID=2995138 RepID=UPI00226E3339|nr:hypothetical protein [Roseateles sp. SL47]WAC71268.1 hypothetical protein OU995_16920 [Roseateles sp. SL47]
MDDSDVRRRLFMNRLNTVAAILILALGVATFGALLAMFLNDLAFHLKATPQVVTVQRVDVHAELVSDSVKVNPSVALTSELMLSTPKGERMVAESLLDSREVTDTRAQMLRSLQGHSTSLFLSDSHPHRFATQLQFPWLSAVALLLPVVLMILPSALALLHHYGSRRQQAAHPADF